MSALHPPAGHEEVRRALATAHAGAGLPASLLLHGPRGVGKQRIALWTAQLALCEAPTPDGPCDACRACRLAGALEHPDLHWYFPLERPQRVSRDRLGDALEAARAEELAARRARPLRASSGGEMRGLYLAMAQVIRRRAYLQPSMARVQVFILGDAELLVPQESSPEAANALLKLLEEPPASTRLILTSSEPGRLLATIRSRTVPLLLAPLPTPVVASFLEAHAGVDAERAVWAAGLSEGSIGRALGFLPEGEEAGPLDLLRAQALDLVTAALSGGRAEGYARALRVAPTRAREQVELFSFVEEWLRDLAAVAAGAPERVVHHDHRPRLEEMVRRYGLAAPDVAAALGTASEAREQARGNVNPQLIVASLVRGLRRALRPPRLPIAASRS